MKTSGYVSARVWAVKQFQAGKASRVIRRFSIRPGDLVYLAIRKSGRERRSNMVAQEANLRAVVESQGGIVAGVFRYVGSGFDPFWVGFAAARARQAGASVLLAEATNRFIRNRFFHSVVRPNLVATDEDLGELQFCAGGMPLMTYLDPDAPPEAVRGYQSSRGQRLKRRKGGRPQAGYKKRRQDKYQCKVRRAYRRIKSIRKIAAQFGIPRSTVGEWVQD